MILTLKSESSSTNVQEGFPSSYQ